MKCLEKDRSRRYDSAKSLADDIRRYLDGEIVKARAPSTLYKLQKYGKRHRLTLAFASLVALTMILGTGASLWQMSKAIEERNAKDAALREATLGVEASAAASGFDRLRRDYPERREILGSRVSLQPPGTRERELLAGLGCLAGSAPA